MRWCMSVDENKEIGWCFQCIWVLIKTEKMGGVWHIWHTHLLVSAWWPGRAELFQTHPSQSYLAHPILTYTYLDHLMLLGLSYWSLAVLAPVSYLFFGTFFSWKGGRREQTNAILVTLCSSPLSGAEIKPYFALLVALQFVPTQLDLYHWDLYQLTGMHCTTVSLTAICTNSLGFVPTHCRLLSLRASMYSVLYSVKYVQCTVSLLVSVRCQRSIVCIVLSSLYSMV